MPPILSADEVVLAVVDRLYGFADPATDAVRALLISVDPASRRLAERVRHRIARLEADLDPPAVRFARAVGDL